ncbi:hypothetical protein C8D90_1026 [Enterobacillus tribolii]|uniref:Uncharacterized protein n=1 Tax=Enterobacillus tribolii TaxID=1487935 RepID=A0A370R0T4_9GAMM|nr:hypothetical protein C8D90_1026 [Enterobacillus tribolii]
MLTVMGAVYSSGFFGSIQNLFEMLSPAKVCCPILCRQLGHSVIFALGLLALLQLMVHI